MDRRKLIVRRFGVLSFGLGYFNDGIWVDHLVATEGTDDEGVAEIHAWLACCGDRAADRLTSTTVAAAVTHVSPDEPVAASVRSAS